MKLDKQILGRFDELVENGLAVENTKFFIDDFTPAVGIEEFTGWLTGVISFVNQVYGANHIYSASLKKEMDKDNNYLETYSACFGVLKSARSEYAGGYLFDLKLKISGEFSEDALEQAEELLEKGYKDPACVVAGVALETSLKTLCDKAEIQHGKLDKMNADLKKAELYNLSRQKEITAWADRRNNAAHGDGDNNSKEDVKAMIDGVRRFIGDYL